MTITRSASAEPTQRVTGGWVGALTLLSIGLWAGWFGPLNELLAQQAESITPDHKQLTLSIVIGVGAAASTISNPVWGAFSDRTILRFGRRLPWFVGGTVGGALSLVLLSQAHSVWLMALAWALVQTTLNAVLAAITAIVPDQVPIGQRGIVGGWVAIAQVIGVVVGTGVASATGSIASGYLAVVVVLLVTAIPFTLRSHDAPLDEESVAAIQRTPFAWGPFVRSFGISPRRYPDFAWAWLTRFLMNLGNALVISYLLYYFEDSIGLSKKHAEDNVFYATVVYGVLTVATAIVGGMWSDRVGKRKVFVIWSGLLMAAALLWLGFATNLAEVYAGAVVLGLGYGVYSSADFAMITQVLPSAEARAKDLGVINIANALPQVIAPGVAAVVTGIGFGYDTLYGIGAVVSLAGSWLVIRIRSLA